MLGKSSEQRGLFEGDALYLDYVGSDSFYGFLASHRGRLFRDEDFSDLYCHTNGRPSVPPSLLATALILQTYQGVSDAEAKACADYDIRWKVALGCEVTDRPFAKSTLQLFRAQLVIHEKARAIFCRSLELARSSGFLRHRKKLHAAIDTMAILGRGAVKDTYNLLADGIVSLVRVLASLCGEKPEAWAAGHELGQYLSSSVKGTAEVDWDDEESRQAFLAGIVGDADRLLAHARAVRVSYDTESDPVRQIDEAAELLLQLLVQDIERSDEGPRIRQGVAKDRIPSVHDPEIRHGHKSSKGRFDGHKGIVVTDTQSQLITAVDVILGNAHDSAMTTELIKQSEENVGLAVAETVGDCAYGTGESRREFSESGRKIIAPVPASPKNGRIPKTSFRIGRKEDRVTCPAGCVTRQFSWVKLPEKANGRRYRVKRFRFPVKRCRCCSLRAQCVKGKGPRTITLHPQEAMMRRARRFQKTATFREAKRRRQVVEHRIARLRQLGVVKARYVGRVKTLFQLLIAATVANLTQVAAVVGSSCLGGCLCYAWGHALSIFRVSWTSRTVRIDFERLGRVINQLRSYRMATLVA